MGSPPRQPRLPSPPGLPQEETEYAFVNILTRGDLSSIRWVCSSLRHPQLSSPGVQLCSVYYASLNFRDIMLATGKLSADAIPGTGRTSRARPDPSLQVRTWKEEGSLPHSVQDLEASQAWWAPPGRFRAHPHHLFPGKWGVHDCLLGMEFSGRDASGRRVMGLVPAEGLATSVLLSQDFLWEVPSSW